MTPEELIYQANQLAGLTVSDIAQHLNIETPQNLTSAKGWVGQALEKLLGATAGSRPLPDFVDLGIELKTLPITLKGEPRESTYICIAPMPNPDLYWEGSLVYHKTSCILWIPILSDAPLAIEQYRILTPLLWHPTMQQQSILKQDWEELTESLNLGRLNALTAHYGQALQIRPKAAHSKILIQTIDDEAHQQHTVPKGFYFRRAFTLKMLREHYHFGR